MRNRYNPRKYEYSEFGHTVHIPVPFKDLRVAGTSPDMLTELKEKTDH